MRKQNVEFKVGRDALRGSLFIPDGKGPFPAVIFFHGSGGKGEKYYLVGEKFPEKGILAFAFNFRGCGRSDGNYLEQTHRDALEDAEKAFGQLLKRNVDPQRIGVVGGSFGGYIASMLCLKLKIKALVLLAPSAHNGSLSARIFRGDLGEEINYFLNKDNWTDSDSFAKISNYTGPLLVIKSEKDENVPVDVPDMYYERAVKTSKREMRVIKGADHRLSEQKWKDIFYDLILDWFSKTL